MLDDGFLYLSFLQFFCFAQVEPNLYRTFNTNRTVPHTHNEHRRKNKENNYPRFNRRLRVQYCTFSFVSLEVTHGSGLTARPWPRHPHRPSRNRRGHTPPETIVWNYSIHLFIQNYLFGKGAILAVPCLDGTDFGELIKGANNGASSLAIGNIANEVFDALLVEAGRHFQWHILARVDNDQGGVRRDAFWW